MLSRPAAGLVFSCPVSSCVFLSFPLWPGTVGFQGPSWAVPGFPLGPSWTFPGPFLAPPGVPWNALPALLKTLEPSFGPLGRLVAAKINCSQNLAKTLLNILEPPGSLLGAFWAFWVALWPA